MWVASSSKSPPGQPGCLQSSNGTTTSAVCTELGRGRGAVLRALRIVGATRKRAVLLVVLTSPDVFRPRYLRRHGLCSHAARPPLLRGARRTEAYGRPRDLDASRPLVRWRNVGGAARASRAAWACRHRRRARTRKKRTGASLHARGSRGGALR